MLLLILASATTLAGRSTANAQVVTLLPTQAGGRAATVTAGDDVTYNLTLTNGTANQITGVDAETGAPDIRFVAGNKKLIIVYATIFNDKCDGLPALAAGGSCTFSVKVATDDEAAGMGGLSADYTVTWGVFYDPNDIVETTLKTHLVAPVFVPEPGTWVLLIMGATALFPFARRRDRTIRIAQRLPYALAEHGALAPVLREATLLGALPSNCDVPACHKQWPLRAARDAAPGNIGMR
jgi:PEP-CTERM motif